MEMLFEMVSVASANKSMIMRLTWNNSSIIMEQAKESW